MSTELSKQGLKKDWKGGWIYLIEQRIPITRQIIRKKKREPNGKSELKNTDQT